MSQTFSIRCIQAFLAFIEPSNVSVKDSLRERLGVFFNSYVGQALVEECQNSHVNSALHGCPKVIEALNTQGETLAVQAFEDILLLASIFLQANYWGPSFTLLRPSEAALQSRLELARELDVIPKSDAPTDWEVVSSFWSTCPFGNPDFKIGERALTLDAACKNGETENTLDLVLASLEVDGEMLNQSIKAARYLWAALQLCSSFMAANKRTWFPGIKVAYHWINGYLAFLWQQALDGGRTALTPTLTMLAVERPLFMLKVILQAQDSEEFQALQNLTVIREDVKDTVLQYTEDTTLEESCTLFSKDWHLSVEEKQRLVFHCLIQLANRLTYFSYPEHALQLIEKTIACQARMQFCFDSVLGKRREFQIHSVPQLIVRVDSTVPADEHRAITHVEPHVRVPEAIPLKELDPVSDVLEQPSLDTTNSTQEAALTGALKKDQSLTLLSYAFATLHRGAARDELLLEQLRAIVDRCTAAGALSCWSLQSTALWYKSHAELFRSKTRDRALLQLQKLMEHYWDRQPKFWERQQYASQVAFPNRMDAALVVGRSMMESGCILSAAEMYRELWMWEEAAECLVAAGRTAQALDLLNQRVGCSPTPRLYCCLGDVHQDVSYYEKAWELSNHRYGRAQRSLGKHFLKKNDFEKAAECFTTALKINPMLQHIWFTLGCCQMRLNRMEEALQSFSRVVALDPESGEAWANMAGVHWKLNSGPAAHKCISMAVKYCHDNWRVWDSFVKMSAELNHIDDCIHGARALLNLGQKARLEDGFFAFLAESAITAINDQQATSETAIVRQVCSFFNDALNGYYSDRASLYDCCARVFSALNAVDTEYAMRLQQFRVIMDTTPESFSARDLERSVAPLLRSAVYDLMLSHRRWYYQSSSTASEKLHKTQELEKVLDNFREKLEQKEFPLQGILLQLRDAVVTLQIMTRDES